MVFLLFFQTGRRPPADLENRIKTITDNLLQTKRNLAFEAFHAALEERMKKEGTLKLMPEKMRGFGDLT